MPFHFEIDALKKKIKKLKVHILTKYLIMKQTKLNRKYCVEISVHLSPFSFLKMWPVTFTFNYLGSFLLLLFSFSISFLSC